MLVTIILDLWRITVGPIVDIPWSASQTECIQFGPPWLRPASDIKGVKDSYTWTSSGMTQESYGLSKLRERTPGYHTELQTHNQQQSNYSHSHITCSTRAGLGCMYFLAIFSANVNGVDCRCFPRDGRSYHRLRDQQRSVSSKDSK